MYDAMPNPPNRSKRSASALSESSDMPLPTQSFSLSYAHYAIIYLDGGKIMVDASPSMQNRRSTLFTPEVRQNFLDILEESEGFQQSNIAGLQTENASLRRVRRRRDGCGVYANNNRYDDGSDSGDHSGATDLIAIHIGDTKKVLSYYEGALKHFQQLNCRMVAKAFIKMIEPRKQVKHPYNGGKPPTGSAPGAIGDPETTRPEWWPPGVMHKEPDHLRKEHRIKLLLHIIRKLGSFGVTADKLKDIAGDTKRSLKDPAHVEIIYEILRVRKMEERFERDEVDRETAVYVQNRGLSLKGNGDNEDKSTEFVDIEADESDEGGLISPTSSVEQITTAPLTTPIYALPIPCSLPGGFSNSVPLRFEYSSPGCQCYAITPQSADSFSQPMLRSQHEVSAFDYPSTPFATQSRDEPYYTRTEPYNSQLPPSFSEGISGAVGYTSSITQPMPPIPCHLSAHLSGMPHVQHPLNSISRRFLP